MLLAWLDDDNDDELYRIDSKKNSFYTMENSHKKGTKDMEIYRTKSINYKNT